MDFGEDEKDNTHHQQTMGPILGPLGQPSTNTQPETVELD